MTAFSHRVLLIVRAADRDRANALAQRFDPLGGELTFSLGLSATGAAPATHYWCCAQMRPAVWAAVQTQAAGFPGCTFLEWNPATEPGKPDAVLTELGLRRVKTSPL